MQFKLKGFFLFIFLKALPADGIKIYALFQHAHLLGTSITTRHIRADTELPPIATDHHYAYSFQDVIVLHGEIEIKPVGIVVFLVFLGVQTVRDLIGCLYCVYFALF